MNRKHILLIVFFPVLGLIISGAVCYFLRRYAPKYTARTYIRVLPMVECGHLTIGAVTGTGTAQYVHRRSLAKLITGQCNLEELVEKDKIQKTKWFKHFGESRAISIEKAIRDLNRHFRAYAEKDTDYILLSMSCRDKMEAALIVNQMVDLFLDSQKVIKTREVSDKLTSLNEQLNRAEAELADAEKALAAVREATQFLDLEEHSYQHPLTTRLIRLEHERDNCLLEVKGLEANIKNLEKQAEGLVNEQIKEIQQANLKNAKDELAVLQTKYAELERMRQVALAKKRDYDLARVIYEQRKNRRYETRNRRNAIETQIGKWKIKHDDPDTPGVKFAGYAPVPLEISSPEWIFYLPAGAILGLIFGIGLALLSRKAKAS